MKRIRHRNKLWKKLEREREYRERLESYGKSWADFMKRRPYHKQAYSEENGS